MKHGRRLTREEKLLLKQEGHNPREYLRERKTHDNYAFIHRATGKILNVRH